MSFLSQPEPDLDPLVAVELRRMQLEASVLLAAVRDANDEALECTTNDVASMAGYLRWGRPLRRLGDAYAPKGFKREHPKNFEMLVSPDRTWALTIAPGDRNTGTSTMPSTRIERGPLTGQAIEGNRHQLGFMDDTLAAAKEFETIYPTLWLLLVYYDEHAEEIRSELSLPVEFTKTRKSERGHVTAFEPRLILPVIDLADSTDADDEDQDEDGQIDVPVARR